MTTNVLPTALPWINLILSAIVLVMLLVLTWRRMRSPRRPLRILLLDWACIVAALVLVAGAAFQANLIPLDPWVVVGTGGRVAFAAIVAALVFTKDDV